MSAFIYSFIFIFAEAGHGDASGGGGLAPYLNYPGFEAWKFINLAIFIAIMIYLLRKPLSEAFKARRELIRAELIRAEEERQAALAQLTSTEAKLAALDSESSQILEKARLEAEAEKTRILTQTEEDVERLRRQSESEIGRLSQQTRAELRRFSAEESIRLAEEKISQQINAQKIGCRRRRLCFFEQAFQNFFFVLMLNCRIAKSGLQIRVGGYQFRPRFQFRLNGICLASFQNDIGKRGGVTAGDGFVAHFSSNLR